MGVLLSFFAFLLKINLEVCVNDKRTNLLRINFRILLLKRNKT